LSGWIDPAGLVIDQIGATMAKTTPKPEPVQYSIPPDQVWLSYALEGQRRLISSIESKLGCIFTMIIIALIASGLVAGLFILGLVGK
jgi:hypothetical protein